MLEYFTATAKPSFSFSHEEQHTGGTKYPSKVVLRAHHPETDEVQGELQYFPPKRKGGIVTVREFGFQKGGPARGAHSALMNEMEARHPGSRVVHMDDINEKNKPKPGDPNFNAARDYGLPTDWDHHYPKLPGDIHRGMGVRLEPWQANQIHSADRSSAEQARVLRDAVRDGGPGGMHWSADPKKPVHFAERNVRDPRTDIPVILHAETPPRKDIETRPNVLRNKGVWPHDHHAGDAEVPIAKGKPVKITGVSWLPEVEHPEADEHGWVHHTFDEPLHRTAMTDYFGVSHERTAGRGKPRRDGGGRGDAAPASAAGDPQQGGQPGEAGEGGGGLGNPRDVEFHPRAVKDLQKLDGPMRNRAKKVIDGLANNAPGLQTHALYNSLAGWSSTKINHDHRIVHRPTDGGGLHIVYVGLHGYDEAARRTGSLGDYFGMHEDLGRTESRGDQVLLHRGVGEHDGKDWSGKPYASAEAWHDDASQDRSGYGRWWGPDESMAKFYGDVGGGNGMVVSAWFPKHVLTQHEGHSAFAVPEGHPAEVHHVQVKDGDGWKDLPHTPGMKIQAIRDIEPVPAYQELDRPWERRDYDVPQSVTEPISRGLTIPLSDADHAYVHDRSIPARTRSSHVINLVSAKGSDEPLGMHWTTSPGNAHHFSRTSVGGMLEHPHLLSVVLHAHPPEDEHIEHDPRTLWHHGVQGQAAEGEVPLKAGSPVRIHGVEWSDSRDHTKTHSFHAGMGSKGIIRTAAHDPHSHVRWGDGQYRSFRGAWGSSRGNSTMITGASAHLMGLPGYDHPEGEWRSGTEKERLALAHHALHVIHKSPGVEEPLFHGTQNPRVKALQVGDQVHLPLTAAAGDSSLPESFARGREGDAPGSIVHFPKGTPYYPQDEYSKADRRDYEIPERWSEAIVAGHFRVADRHEDEEGRTHIHMEHLGTFNPHTKEWAAKAQEPKTAAHSRPDWADDDFTAKDGSLYHVVTEPNAVTLRTPEGRLGGSITWGETEGTIGNVNVREDHQRRGLATELLRRAKEQRPDLEHSHRLSDDAQAWIGGMNGKTSAHAAPTSRVFGPTFGLDHRLFEDEHLKPEVRTAVLARLGPVLEPLLGQSWEAFTRVYLAGSEASEWTSATLEGNGDFDTLIGIDYSHARDVHAVLEGLDDADITDLVNTALRTVYNASPWVAPFGGTWDLTGYVNANSYDITKIKPYAAYNISDDTWAVRPPHLPDWGIDKLPEGGANLLAEAEGYASVIEAIEQMPEPYQTQQGKALWHHLHADRSRAFSDEGEGWMDPGNLIEKALVEWGLWDKLVEWQYGAQKTAGARGDLPNGITYEHTHEDGIHILQARHPDMPDKDKFAGLLSWWDKDGEVGSAQVHPEMQRRGLGTELFRRAKEITPHIHHSDYLTDEAKHWISGMERTSAWKGGEEVGKRHVAWQMGRETDPNSWDEDYLEDHNDAPNWLHDKVAERHKRVDKAWDEFSPEQRENAHSALINTSKKRLFIGTRNLHGILGDGRMKTLAELHEDDESPQTDEYTQDRHTYEHHVMGVSHDTDPILRPVYGSLHDHPADNDYGKYHLELKDHVRPRTTVTNGDSLNHTLRPYGIEDMHRLKPGHIKAMSSWPGIHSMAELGRPSDYMEFHVHGGVHLDDIARIHMYGDLTDSDHSAIHKAHESGIPVTHYKSQSSHYEGTPMNVHAGRQETTPIDLGNGSVAHYRPGMTERDLMTVEGPQGSKQMSWGSLIALSNGEVLKQLPVSKTAVQSGALDIPQEQHDAFETDDRSSQKRKLLELAKNPVSGTHIWRGEVREGDPLEDVHANGVGIHWSVHPDDVLHQPVTQEGHRNVLWHGVVDHPGEQNYGRDHPMWKDHHMSWDREAEVRLKHGGNVRMLGAWIKDPNHPDPGGTPVPRFPEYTGPGWKYHPIDQQVPVAHKPMHPGMIDYRDVGIQHEGVLAYFKTAEEDEDTSYRMQHRPPDDDYGAPLHDLTKLLPADVYTHPHYYGDMGDLSVRDAHQVIQRVKGRPDAKVRIYRSLPAEHADQGFRPGDWVTTSKEYARQHGTHHEDSAHDWPVISTMVNAEHLHNAGDDMREYGYNGPHKAWATVSHKGGYRQEIRLNADGVIKPVKRRAPKTAMPSKHHPPTEDFTHEIHDLDWDDNDHAKQEEDWPGWSHKILYGKVKGQLAGHIVYSENPHGTAISVGKMETRDKQRGKGVASAMQDALAEEHPTHWINHGSRTGPGRAWWDSYEDPAEHRNIHNHPQEHWADDFDIGREHDDPKRVFGDNERPAPPGGKKYADMKDEEGYMAGVVRWHGAEGAQDHEIVHNRDHDDDTRSDILLNAAQRQNSLQHGQWHDDHYSALEHADELADKARESHNGPVTSFVIRKNESNEFDNVHVRDHKPGVHNMDAPASNLDIEYNYHPIHDKIRRQASQIMSYFGVAA